MNRCKNCNTLTKNKKFCSRACMNQYKFQRVKKKSRSKLEIYLSNRLKQDFPWMLLEECNRTLLKTLELDIYLPQFKIAIEVNGGMHYRFIRYFHRTITNFQRQRSRDTKKKIMCQDLGIQLIEVPNLKAFSEKNAEQIYSWLVNVLRSMINDPN